MCCHLVEIVGPLSIYLAPHLSSTLPQAFRWSLGDFGTGSRRRKRSQNGPDHCFYRSRDQELEATRR